MQGILSTLVAGSFGWFVASSLWIYPHSLSYFNESIGGPLNGAEHLLGSNLDWGQDLRYLEHRLSSTPSNTHLNLCCHSMIDPKDLRIANSIQTRVITENCIRCAETIADKRPPGVSFEKKGARVLNAVSMNRFYGLGFRESQKRSWAFFDFFDSWDPPTARMVAYSIICCESLKPFLNRDRDAALSF